MHMSSHAVLRTGMVMDFRGPPVIPLGVLSSSAADMTGVQERCDSRATQDKFVPESSFPEGFLVHLK